MSLINLTINGEVDGKKKKKKKKKRVVFVGFFSWLLGSSDNLFFSETDNYEGWKKKEKKKGFLLKFVYLESLIFVALTAIVLINSTTQIQNEDIIWIQTAFVSGNLKQRQKNFF